MSSQALVMASKCYSHTASFTMSRRTHEFDLPSVSAQNFLCLRLSLKTFPISLLHSGRLSLRSLPIEKMIRDVSEYRIGLTVDHYFCVLFHLHSARYSGKRGVQAEEFHHCPWLRYRRREISPEQILFSLV